LSYVAADRNYLDFFLHYGLCPEVGLDAFVLENREANWHQKIAAELEHRQLKCSLHLPFCDLQPGSMDPYILEASRKRLASALEISALYKPCLLVGHAYFTPLYRDCVSKWLELSIATWSRLLDSWPEHPPLCLENTRESDPQVLLSLLEGLSNYRAGICFDVGHWFSFAQGKSRQNLEEWIACLAPYIYHLHLSDNKGTNDQHLGLGQGGIPWQEFFALLAKYNLGPSFTLEPHNKSALQQGLQFLSQHPDWVGRCCADFDGLKRVSLQVSNDSHFVLGVDKD
jgi:sugar phosphate isomerase/epimerase